MECMSVWGGEEEVLEGNSGPSLLGNMDSDNAHLKQLLTMALSRSRSRSDNAHLKQLLTMALSSEKNCSLSEAEGEGEASRKGGGASSRECEI